MRVKFIVDVNVGKLARWLRMLGYDTLFIHDVDDTELVTISLNDKRVLLTKDTQIMLRRVITSGRVKAMLIEDDNPKDQLRQVARMLKIDQEMKFTRCLECNELLVPKGKDEVRELVPTYVFKTQLQYFQCPACQRIYWRGTHWQRMNKEIEALMGVEV